MDTPLAILETEYGTAFDEAEVCRSARNARREELVAAQAAFAGGCADLLRAEDRLHKASEQLTEARSLCDAERAQA